jgi:hypothetical protein
MQPSSQPSRQPSSQPTGVPSRQPSSQPSRQVRLCSAHLSAGRRICSIRNSSVLCLARPVGTGRVREITLYQRHDVLTLVTAGFW